MPLKKKSKKGGSVVSEIMNEASNLVVPVGLLAARKYLKNRKSKGGKKTKRKRKSKGGSVLSNVISEASNLIVPVGLLASKKLVKKMKK